MFQYIMVHETCEKPRGHQTNKSASYCVVMSPGIPGNS